MTKKQKAEANAAFIEKIKTLQIGESGQSHEHTGPTCPICSKPLSGHKPAMTIEIRVEQGGKKPKEEQSFAA